MKKSKDQKNQKYAEIYFVESELNTPPAVFHGIVSRPDNIPIMIFENSRGWDETSKLNILPQWIVKEFTADEYPEYFI